VWIKPAYTLYFERKMLEAILLRKETDPMHRDEVAI
jgi:hypothetical protein